MGASAIGTLACVDAWIEDFRKDTDRDDDRILPAEVTSRRQAKMIKNVKFIEINGVSHGLTWMHAEEINTQFVKFFSQLALSRISQNTKKQRYVT
jgi:non-heme chloroperoxidase